VVRFTAASGTHPGQQLAQKQTHHITRSRSKCHSSQCSSDDRNKLVMPYLLNDGYLIALMIFLEAAVV
jgi:hypothetical protein